MKDEPLPEHLAAYFTCEPPPGGLPACFAVVTAHNPDGVVQGAAANEAADEALGIILDARGLPRFRVTGRSRDGAHREPGWGIATGSLEQARDFSLAFRQLAFFWVEDGMVYVVNTKGGLRHPVGRWSERLL